MSHKSASEINVSIVVLKAFMRHKADTTAPAKNTGSRVGYTRVSTVAQTLDQQNSALDAAGVTKVFSDVMSGRGATGQAWHSCWPTYARATPWWCGSSTG